MSSSYFLPEKYLYDAILIYNDPFTEKGLIGSYPVSMWFYSFFKLNKLSFSTIGFIQVLIIFILFYIQGVPKKFEKLYLSNTLSWASLIVISVYISIPSKEFINILFAFLIVFFLRKKLNNNFTHIALVLLLIILFGLWFRPYYGLIPFLAITSFVISKIKSKYKPVNIITASLLIAIFMSLSYGVVQGEYMSQGSREALNQKRINEPDSQTLIFSPIKTNSAFGESIGILYGYFSVNIPFEGLKFINKPHVILFVIWQLLLFLILFINYNRCLNQCRDNYNSKIWLFHIIFSYFIIQGIFEPDLGSSIRHKLGILPLIYEAMFYNRLKYIR